MQHNIKNHPKRIASEIVLQESKYWSRCSGIFTLHSLLCGHRIFLVGQVLIICQWRHRSITSTRSRIIFPAAISTKIGATITKLTTIEDVSVSGCFEGRKCWRIL